MELLPKPVLSRVVDVYLRICARRSGLKLRKCGPFYEISNHADHSIRVARHHQFYVLDVLSSFDYYFDAVNPDLLDGRLTVDYSSPRYQEVRGFELFPVKTPSFTEPVVTANQYLDFARLVEGHVVLDLGAYSGLTSILFLQRVGKGGRVVAVDADEQNISCLRKNFELCMRLTGNAPVLLEGAAWSDCGGLEFSSEGNMGSSASSLVGSKRGKLVNVPSFTLSAIVEKFALERVDFVKCDIEGAELEVFKDTEFFARFKPRMIVEPHAVGGVLTTESFVPQLSKYGYRCKTVTQDGVTLPLVECEPG